MKQLARTVVVATCAVLVGSLAAVAGSYTVHLSNGERLETRYPPQFGATEVQFLTKAGNWMTLPQERVTLVTNDTEAGRQARMIDSKTILIGWAPNDAPPPPAPPSTVGAARPASPRAPDTVALILGYLALRGPRPVQNFSVPQFVNTEDVGGGIPFSNIFYFNQAEPEPLEDLLGLSPKALLAIQGIPVDEQRIQAEHQQMVQGVPVPDSLDASGFETVQGLPPGGFQIVQGIPGRWLDQASAAAAAPTSGGPPSN